MNTVSSPSAVVCGSLFSNVTSHATCTGSWPGRTSYETWDLMCTASSAVAAGAGLTARSSAREAAANVNQRQIRMLIGGRRRLFLWFVKLLGRERALELFECCIEPLPLISTPEQ